MKMKASKKVTSFILMLLMCLTLAASANADMLYGAASGGWTTDIMGTIFGGDGPVKVVNNLGGTLGARISAFRTENGGARAAFCEYTAINAPDAIKIYKPYDGTWTPIKDFAGPHDNSVSNIREMAHIGKYLYAIGYDKATVGRFDTTNDAYTNDKTFDGKNAIGGNTNWHGEVLVAYKGYLYGVFTNASNPWAQAAGYAKNRLIKFDQDLNVVDSIDLNGKNIDGGTVGAWALQNGKLYLASIGGSQSYNFQANMASNIDVVDLDKWTVKELISNESLLAQYGDGEKVLDILSKNGWGFDFKSIAVTPRNDVYIMMNGWGPNNSIVIKTTVSDLENAKTNVKETWDVIKEFEFDSFVFPAMLYDPDASMLYVCGAEGDEHTGSLYRYNGTDWLDRYEATDLGGAFSAVAAAILLKPVTYITSSDVSIASDAGSVMINSITVSDDVPDLSGKDDYSTLINGLDSAKAVYPGSKIIIDVDHSGAPDSAMVTFTIKNFTSTPSAGGSFKAFAKKHGAEKYDIFDTEYNAAAKTLTFTIGPAGEYFSEGTVVIGEVADKRLPNPDGGSSSGGCNAGAGALMLLAMIPIVLKSRK